MSSVKALVTKSATTKKRFTLREKPKLGSPLYGNLATFNVTFFKTYQNYTFIMPKPQRDMNALSSHSGQF